MRKILSFLTKDISLDDGILTACLITEVVFKKKIYLKTFEQRSLCDNEKLIHTYTYDLVKQSYLH